MAPKAREARDRPQPKRKAGKRKAAGGGADGRAGRGRQAPRAAVLRRPAAAAKAGGGRASAAAARKRPAASPAAARRRGTVAGGKKAKNTEAAKTDWRKLSRLAMKVHGLYFDGCAFPLWSAQLLSKGKLEAYARDVVVYYKEGDDPEAVKRLAREREPANIAMHRCYDEDMLEDLLGYRHGAYAEGGLAKLMPNIAIYCRTPMRSADGAEVSVHVINLVGFAFDSAEQPDFMYFFPLKSRPGKWKELVQCMQQVWRYAFECARRKGLRRIYLADVGGGAFSGGRTGLERYRETSYAALKEASLSPVQKEYADDGIDVFQLQRIPDWAFSEEAGPLLEDSLLVNAWDPWSMVGNANGGDNSLDGFFGRCTAMALLCWPGTNPHLTWESVRPPGGEGGARGDD